MPTIKVVLNIHHNCAPGGVPLPRVGDTFDDLTDYEDAWLVDFEVVSAEELPDPLSDKECATCGKKMTVDRVKNHFITCPDHAPKGWDYAN